jgi:outer membrane lipopolysaccharide assembly protein LptE/RlpB
MNKRQFLKSTAALSSLTLLSGCDWETSEKKRLQTAHIGVGNMGGENLKAISSYEMVDVVTLCDVDSKTCLLQLICIPRPSASLTIEIFSKK